jgi:hypothetical protein
MTHPKLLSTRRPDTAHRSMVQKCNMQPKIRHPLSDKHCITIQKITGSVLYYSRAVDPTVIISLSYIATEQTTAMERTKNAAGQLLDYLVTHPDATIRFHASDMILHMHSDASYLSVSKARSRLVGLFYIGCIPPNEDKLNGSILNVASVIKNVVPSAAESEVGACFQNAKTAAPLHITLLELGHKQPVTPMRTDNSTDYGILNETIKQKRSKSMDMKYYWLQDRGRQKQFDVYWRPSKYNLEITIPNTIQRNIIKICALYYSIRLTA